MLTKYVHRRTLLYYNCTVVQQRRYDLLKKKNYCSKKGRERKKKASHPGGGESKERGRGFQAHYNWASSDTASIPKFLSNQDKRMYEACDSFFSFSFFFLFFFFFFFFFFFPAVIYFINNKCYPCFRCLFHPDPLNQGLYPFISST